MGVDYAERLTALFFVFGAVFSSGKYFERLSKQTDTEVTIEAVDDVVLSLDGLDRGNAIDLLVNEIASMIFPVEAWLVLSKEYLSEEARQFLMLRLSGVYDE